MQYGNLSVVSVTKNNKPSYKKYTFSYGEITDRVSKPSKRIFETGSIPQGSVLIHINSEGELTACSPDETSKKNRMFLMRPDTFMKVQEKQELAKRAFAPAPKSFFTSLRETLTGTTDRESKRSSMDSKRSEEGEGQMLKMPAPPNSAPAGKSPTVADTTAAQVSFYSLRSGA